MELKNLMRQKRGLFTTLLIISFLVPESSYVAQANTPVAITGLVNQYGPEEKVSYKISGTAGDSCQLSYQNQSAKSFTMGSAGSVTASFTTGPSESLIVINVTCVQSGSASAQSRIVLANPTPTPTISSTLPGIDASINSTLSSIIEPLPGTCEEGELVIIRADGLGFSQGDNVKANVYNSNNVELRLAFVVKSAFAGERSIETKIKICHSDPSYIGALQDYRLVMTYSDAPAYFVQNQEYQFRLISRTEVTNFSQFASSQVRSKCVFDNKSSANSYTQSGTTRKSGEKMTIKGTFYRAGLIAPNDTLKLVRVVNPSKSEVVATTTTDRDGKYTFTFNALTYPKAILYRIEAPERQADLGPVPGPFSARVWNVYIDCKKGCKIGEYSMRDEVPVNNFTELCLQSLSFYNQVLGQSDDENSRILRKVIIYPILSSIIRSRTDSATKAAAEAARAADNSSSTSSSATNPNSTSPGTSANKPRSSTSGGGRCYVKGYTTKKGKRVSGYYRSC